MTDIHALGGIATRIPSKRAAPDPRHRPRDHWDRLFSPLRGANPCPGTSLRFKFLRSFTLFLAD